MVIGTTAALVIAGVSLAVGIAGSVASYMQQQKAAKQQKKARNEALRKEEAQVRRQRRQAIREAQIKRAQVVNFGEATGTGGSSSVDAATGSIGSQLGSNIGFGNMMSSFNANIAMHEQKALDAQQRASTFQGIADLGFQVAGAAAGSIGSFGGGPTGGTSFNASGTSRGLSGGFGNFTSGGVRPNMGFFGL